MSVVTLLERAPAKINLTLDVLGKRADGYHDLRSVMASVSLYDDLTVTLRPCGPGLETFSAHADGVDDDENIAARAARLYLERRGLRGWGAHIDIVKRIPIGAGLGGGSSDAAAVLRALDGWAAADGQRPPLQEIALELGSDVPYCLRGGVCLAEGRGEILTPLPPLPAYRVVLCTPPVVVSTAGMFARLDGLGRQALDNVFEAVVNIPEVAEIKGVLTGAGAKKAAMSGSGPSVFGLYDDETLANQAFQTLLAVFPNTFLLRFV